MSKFISIEEAVTDIYFRLRKMILNKELFPFLC